MLQLVNYVDSWVHKYLDSSTIFIHFHHDEVKMKQSICDSVVDFNVAPFLQAQNKLTNSKYKHHV